MLTNLTVAKEIKYMCSDRCEISLYAVSLYMDTRLSWFEALYDSYADAIFRYLAMRVGDRERAKELTQEVFLKAWQYRMAGKTIQHEKAFLYRVAKNLFINEIRTDKKMRSLDALSQEGFEPPDEQAKTNALAEHRELLDHLSHIHESYQEILTMRYTDGLSVKEIAEILDKNETAVSMSIARGIEALKETYIGNQSS